MRPESLSDTSFRARVGERSFDICVKDGRLYVNEEPVEALFERLSKHHYSLILDGRSYSVVMDPDAEGATRVTIDGRTLDVDVKDKRALLLERFGLNDAASARAKSLRAPMPGLVLSVMVDPGDAVREGQGLLVLEAMKMENELRAPSDGVVRSVHVSAGDAVKKTALLIDFES